MTVSTSVGRQFTINQIVSLAYKHAGLVNIEQEPSPEQAEFARKCLELIVDQVGASRNLMRVQDFYNLTLVEDQILYTLPNSILEVKDYGAYIEPGETLDRANGETVLRKETQDVYQRISAKGAKGRPTIFYADRSGDDVKVFMWPIPDRAGTVRFQIGRKLADTDDGNATFDLQPHWMPYLRAALARDLCRANSLYDQASIYDLEAFQAERQATAQAQEHAERQMYINHQTQWGQFSR